MAEKIINTGEQLRALIKLQILDKQIYRLKDEQKLKPEEIAKLREGFKDKGDNLKMCEDQLKALQLKMKDKEGVLGSKEENVKKYQTQLNLVKTNKEYAALQKEIEGLKADNSLLEEEIIGLLEEIDLSEGEVAREKEALAEKEKELKEEESKVKERMQKIEEELNSLVKDRQLILPGIEPLILTHYDKVLENREGYALAEVVNDACGGCQMELPPQTINEIRMEERIVSCEVCTRILYVRE